MTGYFDLISFVAVLICLQTLLQLFQNWSKFWDDRVTFKDSELAQRLAVFVLIPIGVLLHEMGHALATWQVGGTVSSFQWRFYWGYIIPSGNFSAVEFWWIALSGNLVSIFLALLPIPFILYIRKRIVAEILYSFACVESIYSLVAYPLLSFAIQAGDWKQIYNFEVRPYAFLTLIAHLGLLWGLWHLYHAQKAIAWRLARKPGVLETWEKLKLGVGDRPNDLQAYLELGYFLLNHNEVYEAKKVAKKIDRLASNDEETRVFRVVLASSDRAYRKAIRASRKLLSTDLLPDNQLRLYRILCFSLSRIHRLQEALSYANEGLTLDPHDYKLRCHRAVVYSTLGRYQETRSDLDVALENAPDPNTREEIQEWSKQFEVNKV